MGRVGVVGTRGRGVPLPPWFLAVSVFVYKLIILPIFFSVSAVLDGLESFSVL